MVAAKAGRRDIKYPCQNDHDREAHNNCADQCDHRPIRQAKGLKGDLANLQNHKSDNRVTRCNRVYASSRQFGGYYAPARQFSFRRFAHTPSLRELVGKWSISSVSNQGTLMPLDIMRRPAI